MRQLTIIMCVVLLPVTAGCSRSPRLDASSDEALKKSLERMTAGMSDEQKKQFGADCMAVVFPDAMKQAFQDAFKRDKPSEPATSAKLFKPLDGLTVSEIQAKAEEVRARMRAGRPDPPQKEVDAKPATKQAKKEASPEPPWTPPTKAVQQGDLQVRIAKTSIGKVPLKDFGRSEGSSKDDLLMVKLDLLNVNPTKKVEYQSWAGRDFSFDRDYATLKDNFGNSYKRITFGFASHPVGAVERAESIYPNKSVSDMLVFEVPLDTATHLDLELPAKNYGSDGMIRFRIPINSVSRE